MLAPDQVDLYPGSGQADAHGWALPPEAEAAWSGQGNLQAQPGRSDARATDGGGHGPYEPGQSPSAVLLLPPEAEPQDGQVAMIRGRPWVLSQTRLVLDPLGEAALAPDALTCYAATATEVGSW
jgi:hypothetical protein